MSSSPPAVLCCPSCAPCRGCSDACWQFHFFLMEAWAEKYQGVIFHFIILLSSTSPTTTSSDSFTSATEFPFQSAIGRATVHAHTFVSSRRSFLSTVIRPSSDPQSGFQSNTAPPKAAPSPPPPSPTPSPPTIDMAYNAV